MGGGGGGGSTPPVGSTPRVGSYRKVKTNRVHTKLIDLPPEEVKLVLLPQV